MSNLMSPFERIIISGDMPIALTSGQSWADGFEAFCGKLAAAGFTHVQVNHLADPYHSILLEQPDNYYAWFANYGPALDQFVTSDLFEGVYLEALLDRNRQKLLAAVEAARKAGLKPHLLLCEPRFVPERFLAKHPQLRGPRVDNPACSTTPWYALCTDVPAVQEHYRQMMRKMMQLVPDIDSMSLFTHDSGAGFCHSESLYSGPNGPRQCKKGSVAKRVADFIGLLVETAREVNPNCIGSLGTGLHGQERKDYTAVMPEGVTLEAIGAYSWHGGLEEHWAQQQYGSKLKEVGYDKAREERVEEFKQWVDMTKQQGHDSIGVNNFVSDGYMKPLTYIIHPQENLRVMDILREMGCKHLHARGQMCPLIEFDINHEVIRRYLADPENAIKNAIREAAVEWLGEVHADTLARAWELAEKAYNIRPMWTHMLSCNAMMAGPLVPDPDGVPREEMEYVWHQGWSDLESLPDRHRLDRIGIADENERAWMLGLYREESLPMLKEAVEILQQEAKECDDDKAVRCLLEQADSIQSFALWLRSMYNWLEAGCYLLPGKGTPDARRSIGEIVDDEIALTQELFALYNGRLEKFVGTGTIHGMLHGFSPRFMDQLTERIEVMKRHRNDPVQRIELGGRS